ncbi:ABC transporter substrate-binding protein [uncultured Methylobacterium sp.]|uniref:ABC transporter substrate-binding protein n=1 Tax=uncultured Methylobacterium sp. TaxID=157278 RepID=UPI0025968810|nr:ABC transporter substrate-binding protein [uncultured Methylobacterium sp.]
MKFSSIAAGLAVSLAFTLPADAQISGDVVRIGVLNDQSGVYSDLGGAGSVLAAHMAVEDFGKTVAGKPIEIVAADHQNKPDIGAAIARKWFDADAVDVIVDVPHSATALAVLNISRERNKPVLLSGPAASEITGPLCSRTAVHWTYDSYANGKAIVGALAKQGLKTWFFITGDNAGTQALERDATKFIKEAGGTVTGSVRHPFGAPDFASYLMVAEGAPAQIIGLANAGADTINSVKQASEFGLRQSGKNFAALLMFITDVKSIGLRDAQGMYSIESFYWDLDDKTRAWSKRFSERHHGRQPTAAQAGVYGAVLHYLKAVEKAATDDGVKVVDTMKELPVNDFWSDNFRIRKDGRLVRDMYLFQVKSPTESGSEWDLYKLVSRVPGDAAFRPLDEGNCPLIN